MRQHLKGHGFDPETARLLGLAFEMALVALQHADRVVSPTRDVVAQKIIELAKAGERDPGRLCDAALEACLQSIVSDPSPRPPHASQQGASVFLDLSGSMSLCSRYSNIEGA